MLEELDGASPKDFATCSKANRRRGLGDRSVSAYRNWAFPRKTLRRDVLILGVGEQRPAWVWDLGGPLQGRNCSHPSGSNHPEQASTLVEKGQDT